MPIKKLLYSRFVHEVSFLLIGILVVSCSTQGNIAESQNTEDAISEPAITASCPAMESRKWHAWIDQVKENEPRLNISGEVDLPTPGYQVEWKPGILERTNPPTQHISISFVPPQVMTIQVITPTEINFTLPSPVLEYRSVMIYCGDKLLANIPDVIPSE